MTLLVALYVVVVWAMYRFGPYADLSALTGGPLLEERFDWGTPEARAALAALGEVGLEAYRRFQAADVLGAAFASLVLITVIQWGVGRVAGSESRWHDLAIVPLAGCAAELVENTALFTLTFTFPDLPGGLVAVAAWATKTKFVLGIAAFVTAGGAVLVGWWNLWLTRP